MNNANCCPTKPILAAIASNELRDEELIQWESHLERCPTCCQNLETIAADEPTWESCRSFLPDDPYDKQRFTFALETDGGNADSEQLLHFRGSNR